MAGKLVLLFIPLLITALCFIMRDKQSERVFCLSCASIFFFVFCFGTGGKEFERISMIYTALPSVPYSTISSYSGSPGLIRSMKICSEFNSDARSFFLVTMLILCALLGWHFLTRCSKPYAGVAVFSVCFLLYRFVGAGFFAAAVLCMYAFSYFRENRFFRFAGIILLASCFDMSAVFLIPLYFIMQIPAVLVAAVLCALAAWVPLMFPELSELIFGFVTDTRTVSFQLPLLYAVVYMIFALIFIAASLMFTKRGKNYGQLTVVMFAGAAFSLSSVFDGRFFPISAFLMIPSAVVLAPEAYEIGKTFLEIVFPQAKRTAKKTGFIICMAMLYGCCIYGVFSGAFGTDTLGSAFF